MKKTLFLILCYIPFISSCMPQTINVPSVMENVLLVTHFNQSTLSYIDTREKEILETATINNVISDIVRIDRDKLIFSDKKDGHLYQLDTKSGKVKKLVEVGKGINQLLFDDTRNILFLTNSPENQVHSYDIKSNSITTTVEVGTYPLAMALNKKKGHLYVINTQTNEVSVIHIEKGKVLNSFPIIERPSGVWFDGKLIWIGGHGGSGTLNEHVYLYDPDTGREVKKIKVGVMPSEIYSHHNRSFIYVLCHGSNEVYRINSSTLEVVDSLEVGANPNALIGDEQTIFVTNMDSNSVTIINEDTFSVERTIETDLAPFKIILGGEVE